jgi:predicted nucleic acid-binding protein
MTAPVFVDTNVFVYRFDSRDPFKQRRAEVWLDDLWSSGAGRVSFQVLEELYSTLTRKLRPGLPAAEARSVVRALSAWKPVAVDATVIEAAWSLQDGADLSWWDALIVAAAQLAGCGRLLTEDLQHGQRFGGVEVLDPFQISFEVHEG